jgi:hypothetical protein
VALLRERDAEVGQRVGQGPSSISPDLLKSRLLPAPPWRVPLVRLQVPDLPLTGASRNFRRPARRVRSPHQQREFGCYAQLDLSGWLDARPCAARPCPHQVPPGEDGQAGAGRELMVLSGGGDPVFDKLGLLDPRTRATTEQPSGQNGYRKKDLGPKIPRSVRVRRQGLEPRTRGLRVRCSVRLFFLNCYQTMLARAGSCHFVQSPASVLCCGYRVVPGCTGASEQTWSKHRRRKV